MSIPLGLAWENRCFFSKNRLSSLLSRSQSIHLLRRWSNTCTCNLCRWFKFTCNHNAKLKWVRDELYSQFDVFVRTTPIIFGCRMFLHHPWCVSFSSSIHFKMFVRSRFGRLHPQYSFNKIELVVQNQHVCSFCWSNILLLCCQETPSCNPHLTWHCVCN